MTESNSWPPPLTTIQETAALHLASDWALSHGLVLRPTLNSQNEISTTSAIHGPYTLFPSPFPRNLFEEAYRVESIFNALYCHIAVNDEFLRLVVGEGVAKVDEFQGELYKIWNQVKMEGGGQELSLGLCRSDYLIHDENQLKQVEFNTISSSFGPLATRVTQLHRHLLSAGIYPSRDFLKLSNLPINNALKGLAKGLALSHQAYDAPDAKILMIVQENERNAFDQRLIEFELLETHNLQCLRLPFSTLHNYLSLHPKTSTLLLSHPSYHSSKPIEISVIYFRAGYTPNDYPTPTQWETRLLLERSLAIKCPSVGLQLAGSKKVQQVLAQAGVLEQFLGIGSAAVDAEEGLKVVLSKVDEEEMKKTFMGLYPMDDSVASLAVEATLRTDPSQFVLKPQREGGGNNIYRSDIIPFLDSLQVDDDIRAKELESQNGNRSGLIKGKEGFILMDLINSPKGNKSILIKAGQQDGEVTEVVSELGIYGVILFKQNKNQGGGAEILLNETVGHLLRTKGIESDEGGVAVGFSVIDSVLLI